MLKNPLFSDCSSKKRMIEDRQCLENVLTDLLYLKSFFNGVTIRFMCDFQGTDFDLYFFYPSALFAPSFYSIFFCLPLPESFSGYPNACGLTPDVPAGVFSKVGMRRCLTERMELQVTTLQLPLNHRLVQFVIVEEAQVTSAGIETSL